MTRINTKRARAGGAFFQSATPSRTSLKAAPAPRSAERIALRAAVDRHDAALRRLGALGQAKETAEQAKRAARKAVTSAQGALDEAVADADGPIAETTQSDVAALVRERRAAVRSAKEACNAADESYADAKATEDVIAQQHALAERELTAARHALADRIAAVVRADPATRKLVTNFEQARRSLMDLHLAMQAVSSKNALPDDARFWDSERGDRPMESAAADQMKAWFAALERDADATLD